MLKNIKKITLLLMLFIYFFLFCYIGCFCIHFGDLLPNKLKTLKRHIFLLCCFLSPYKVLDMDFGALVHNNVTNTKYPRYQHCFSFSPYWLLFTCVSGLLPKMLKKILIIHVSFNIVSFPISGLLHAMWLFMPHKLENA